MTGTPLSALVRGTHCKSAPNNKKREGSYGEIGFPPADRLSEECRQSRPEDGRNGEPGHDDREGLAEDTKLLEHALMKLDMAADASPELVRETLAAVCDRAISMALKHRCGAIVLEKGLGKLRSSGKSRSLNRLLNFGASMVFVQMLTRRARLAGIDVLEVWAGYSSTIGNLAFDAPDACASATEIARRGIARLAGIKDVLPALEEGCVSSLWKNGKVSAELGSWQDVHRTIKAAKIGYRRPHPDVPLCAKGSDVHGAKIFCGHAVVRPGRRHRPGLMFRPIVTERLFENNLIILMLANSEVPIEKLPSASASSVRLRERARSAGTRAYVFACETISMMMILSKPFVEESFAG